MNVGVVSWQGGRIIRIQGTVGDLVPGIGFKWTRISKWLEYRK